MGSSRYRSWSHSRQGIFDRCERAFHYQYYSWDEPDTDEARFLARVGTHEMIGGDAVHWAIALALRAFQRDRTVLGNLQEAAVRRYREACTASKWMADGMKVGKKPANEGIVLHSDVYGYDAKERYWAARNNVETCLTNFEQSEHWAFIRATNPLEWEEVDPPKVRMPTFRLPEAELREASVYAGFDLAFRHEGSTYILDWKTGKRSRTADSQLAVYALCASLRDRHQTPIDKIQVQAVWLQEQSPWETRSVTEEELAVAKERIAAQILLEESRGTRGMDGRGKLALIASRDQYKPTPSLRKCAECKFGLICEEGKAAVLPA